MSDLVLYIAQSLDGYIADPQGSVSWLEELPNPDKTDYGFHDFLASVDKVIMGRKTFDSIIGFDIPWPYPQQESYIISSKKPSSLPDSCQWLQDLRRTELETLKSSSRKDLWLVGGGSLVKHCLEQELIDRIILFTMPICLGGGIELFPSGDYYSTWQLERSQDYQSGVVEQDYRLKT